MNNHPKKGKIYELRLQRENKYKIITKGIIKLIVTDYLNKSITKI